MMDGAPIQKLPAPKPPVSVNIHYEREDNVVPEYEQREACIYANYNWHQWVNLIDWYERAMCVAQYRLHHMIESHVQDKSNRASKAANSSVQGRTAQPRRSR